MRRRAKIHYALAQNKVDPSEKRGLAEWVLGYFPLESGAGVFLDAGSSCLLMWEAIRQRIAKGELSHLTVATNNFMVLQDWARASTFHSLQGTEIDVVGETFDPLHLAFYGQERRKLMSRAFRPSVSFIGTSGIELEGDSVLLGYHSGELERESKELLFRTPCKKRIILATCRKIGHLGGRVFDLLSLSDLDATAPIYLVTTGPRPDASDEEKRLFRQSKDTFLSNAAIPRRGLKFHWVTLDFPSSEHEDKKVDYSQPPQVEDLSVSGAYDELERIVG